MAVDIYLLKTENAKMNWPQEAAESFRAQYISALKAADHSGFQPLIDLHREYFIKSA
jgi:hypothetical protein